MHIYIYIYIYIYMSMCVYTCIWVCGGVAIIPYTGKLSREKTFQEFRSFVAICKSFLCKIWGCGVLWGGKVSNPRKFFLRKSYFSPIRESFRPRKFPAIWYLCEMELLTPVMYVHVHIAINSFSWRITSLGMPTIYTLIYTHYD